MSWLVGAAQALYLASLLLVGAWVRDLAAIVRERRQAARTAPF